MATLTVANQGLLTSGTVVVARCSSTEIVIAADTSVDVAGGTVDENNLCKIRRIGNAYYSFAHLMYESRTGFDLIKIVDSNCGGGNSLAEKSRRLEGAIKAPLERALTHIKTSNPERYVREYENKYAVMVAFFGFEDGLGNISGRFFKASSTASGVVISPEGFDGSSQRPPTQVYYTYMGEVEEAFRYDQGRKGAPIVGPVHWARKLVEVAIEANPRKVGPPIDIIRITAKGVDWVQAKRTCK